MVVDDLLLAVLPLDEVLIHAAVERTGPEERQRGDQVLEAARAELGDHLPHAAAFHLEDADGVALGEQLVGLGVVERQLRQVEVGASGRFGRMMAHGVGEEGQRLQAEEVELDEADPLDVVHRVLREHRAFLVDEERQVLRERSVGDDDAGGVAARRGA